MIKKKLNLEKYLKILFDHNCVILKNSQSAFLPEIGSDIDILSPKPKKVLQNLIASSEAETKNGLIIRVSYGKPSSYIHLDFIDKNQIIIRLDFLLGFSNYNKIKPDENFLTEIFKTKEIKIEKNNPERKTYVPRKPFEALIRYIDYQEHLGQQSKQKHIEFINTQLNQREKFEFNRLKKKYANQ